MSFFSRFFSSSPKQPLPGLEELLEARGLQDAGFAEGGFRKVFETLKADEREAAADAIVSLQAKALPMPPPWEECQYELMPQIAPAWQGQRDPYFYTPCFDNLCKRLLAAGKPIPEEWLTLWGITEEEAMDFAMERLEEMSKDKPLQRLPSGIYASDYGDGLDSSRILLPRFWNGLFPGQNTFVAIPRADTLLVAPQVLLPKLVEAIGSSAVSGGTDVLALTFYQWVGDKLMPANLQEPHPMIQPQREFRQTDLLAAYSAQAEELLKQDVGTPCNLGILKTQQGRTLTVAAWNEGKTVLVPDCDLIGFVSSKGKPLGLYWRQTLPRVNRLRGLPVDIWGPRRLAFKEFPTASELEELEMFAKPEEHAQIMGGKAGPQRPQQPQQSPQARQAQHAQHASSSMSAGSSPVPAHLRGLSLGVKGED